MRHKTIKAYQRELVANGIPRQFIFHTHPIDPDRIHVIVRTEGERQVIFDLIRTSIGRWKTASDGLPPWLTENIGALVKAAQTSAK